jgi:glycosyltransferase involved in cell wall biosynthesis
LNILYIHQYFKTPSEGGAIRSYYIATGMVQAGHSVEIITAHNHRNYLKKDVEGLSIHYLPVKYYNHYSFLRRLYSFLFFAHKAYYLARKLKNTDLAYITSTPLSVGLVALKLKRKYGIPYVFEVRDLWPEAPIQLGIIKNRISKYISRKFELIIYKEAIKIVVLSPGIKDHVTRLVPQKPIHFCPNMSDCDFYEKTSVKNTSLLKKHNLEKSFVISYFGAISKVNALTHVLDLARIVADSALEVRFLVIGAGAMLDSLRKRVMAERIDNLEFIPHMNKYALKDYLTVTDAAFISFADFPVLEHNSPNKFFDAIASGKLVIVNTRGWIKEHIEKSDCGFYINPAHSEQFINKIKPFFHKSRLEEVQCNARKLAESIFEKQKLIRDLLDFIRK